MTGMHTGHSSIRGNYPFKTEGNLPIPDESVTVAEIFKDKGYTTGMMGKWGLGGPGSVGGPTKQGFDYSFAYLDQRQAHDYYIPYLWKNEEKYVIDGNQNGAKGVYSHYLFAEEAFKFIRENEKNPFFLYLPFTIPHGEHVIPSNAPYDTANWTEKQKNYAAMITLMDGDVGKIMDLIKELKLDENTIIFFSSDNGGLRDMVTVFDSNGPFRGIKGDLYEGGIRVPLIVRWPGKIAPGTVSNHVSAFWDFVPTASELIGAKAPENIDGISYLPTLLGGKQPQHEFLYWEFFNPQTKSDEQGNINTISIFTQQAVRMGDWKAVRTNLSQYPNAPFELYNLKNDIGETKNVATQNPNIIRKIEDYVAGARYDVEYFSRK
jgi:arylsulfatase A-like enzyme